MLGQVLPLLRRTPGAIADAEVYARYRRTLDVLPLTDPYVLLQSLLAVRQCLRLKAKH